MPIDFVPLFDKTLIQSVGVRNSSNVVKVFIHRSLTTLEENRQRHKEALTRITSLEYKVAKLRATARTIW